MTLDCKINGCDYTGEASGLRSHVHTKRDDEHDEAAENEAWEDWHPKAYGQAPEEPEDPPAEGEPEGEVPPDEGDSEGPPDDVAQQEALVEANVTPESGDGEESDDPDETPSEGGTEGTEEGSEDPGRGGKALALLAGSAAVAFAALAAAGKSDREEGAQEPIDVEGEVVETESQSGSDSPTPQDAL